MVFFNFSLTSIPDLGDIAASIFCRLNSLSFLNQNQRVSKMLSGETVIISSEDNSLVLTNKRVKYEVKSKSKSVYKSIPIDKVATCALDTRTFPILLLLAAVAVLVIFAAPEAGQRIGAGIAALVLVAAYFGSRNGQLEIFASSGESIAVPTKGLSHDQVKKFLEAVEAQYEEALIHQSGAIAARAG